MRRKIAFKFLFIIILAILAGIAVWPSGPDIKIGSYHRLLQIKQGLDLKGGTQLVYQADMSKVDPNNRQNALNSLVNVIDRRVNTLGVSEPVIQTSKVEGKDSVIVELPGITVKKVAMVRA